MKSNLISMMIACFLIACGESETSPSVETDVSIPDMEYPLDAEIGQTVDQHVAIPDMSAIDQGVQPCEPALALTSSTSAARAFDLVRLVPSGGTGQWTFALTQDSSGGSVNRETGVYLAGEEVGGVDIVTLTDEGCEGSASISLEVVRPMLISPTNPQVAPSDIFRFEVSGGSGEFEFTLLNETSSAVTEEGVFIAGGDLGWDLLQITDVATSQSESVRITLSSNSRIEAQDETIFLSDQTRYAPVIDGGSGVYIFDSDNPVVETDGAYLIAAGSGTATVTVTDAFLTPTRTTQIDVKANVSLSAPLAPSSDGTSSARLMSIPDINGDGMRDLLMGHGEADVAAGNGGVVYVYTTLEDGTLNPEPAQRIASAIRDDNLGWSIAVGDVTSDGISDLIVGVRLGDFGAGNSGGVSIYPGLDPMASADGLNSFFSEVPLYTLPGVNGSDFLGTSVSVCDFNGDGRLDLAAAAAHYEDRTADPVQNTQGGIFVYLGTDDGLDPTPDIILGQSLGEDGLENTPNLRLGEFSAGMAAGDFNGDGNCDLAVGSMRFQSNTGLIHLFLGYADNETRRGGLSRDPAMLITETRTEVDGVPVGSGQLGRGLSMGDVNGDGKSDLLIAQMVGDVGGRDGGVTYLFLGKSVNGVASAYTSVETADWYYAGSAYDYNGWSVVIDDINGDQIQDVITASIYDDFPSLNNTGAIYAFYGRGGGLPNADPDVSFIGVVPDSRLGESIALKADEDGDGLLDLAVYATRSDRYGLHVGALEVMRSGPLGEEELPQTYPLNTTAQPSAQRFGQGLDFVGDLDGDGFEDVVVASSFSTHQDASNRSGTAWIYYGTATGLETEPVQVAAFPELGGSDLLWQASRAGDFDQDGFDDFAVLLRSDERSSTLNADNFLVPDNCQERLGDQGGVYIFRGGQRNLIGQQPAFAYWGGQRSLAPERLVGVGDVDGDGFDDIAMGAFRWDDGPSDVGAFDIIGGRTYGGDGRIQVICNPVLRQIGSEQAGNLGNAIAGLGDFDGDGCDDFAVGAEGEAGGGPNRQGVVWLFRGKGKPGCPADFEAARLSRGEGNARLGSSLAAGDVDGDGIVDLAIGSRNRNVQQATRGGALVLFGHALRNIDTYPLFEVGGQPLHQIDTENEAAALGGTTVNSEFGRSVAISGSVLAVGAPADQIETYTPLGTVKLFAWNAAANALQRFSIFVGETDRLGGRLGEIMSGSPSVPGRFLIGGTRGNGSGLDNGSVYDVRLTRP